MEARLIFPTLRAYEAGWFGPDVLAGLTLAAVAVPEQMATARLANLAAVAGLYAFIAGSLLFAVLGRSGQMSVGADSTIAPVLAAGVAAIAAVGTPRYADLMSFLALMVGALVVAVGLLRLGWIAEFLSTPVITGVLAGIAVEIVVRQLPEVLGLAGGGSTTVGRLGQVAGQIGHVNAWSVGMAVGVFALIMVGEHSTAESLARSLASSRRSLRLPPWVSGPMEWRSSVRSTVVCRLSASRPSPGLIPAVSLGRR